MALTLGVSQRCPPTHETRRSLLEVKPLAVQKVNAKLTICCSVDRQAPVHQLNSVKNGKKFQNCVSAILKYSLRPIFPPNIRSKFPVDLQLSICTTESNQGDQIIELEVLFLMH